MQAIEALSLTKRSVRDIDVEGKTALLRVDFNVPFTPGTTKISDDSRITASLPTLRYLIERRCRVVVCSHLGRPMGRVVNELRMASVGRRLSELLRQPVVVAPDSVGTEVKSAVEALSDGDVLLLENVRFHCGEEANDAAFSTELASMAEVYVNDAFGAAHRTHASTVGVTEHLPAVAGLLMAKELEVLGRALESPKRPFVAVLGGAKVSDKIAALDNLVGTVDTLIVGGGMAATFLRAQGHETGESLVEEERIGAAAEVLRKADDQGIELLLPEDAIVADTFAEDAAHQVVATADIPAGWRIMDIGPDTADSFERALSSAATVIWNGPMGVFEWPAFSQGTARIAAAVAKLQGATTIIGGGSTAEAVTKLGLADSMTHVSTGGGASLELLAGRTLPGVTALLEKEN